LSTTEAEYVAACDGSKEVIWLKGLYAEFCEDTSCITLFCDSQSAIYLTKDQMFHERTKHIDIKYHYNWEIVAEGKLRVCKISTCFNLADMMSKTIPGSKIKLSWYNCLALAGMMVTGGAWRGGSPPPPPRYILLTLIRVLCCVTVITPLVSRCLRTTFCKHFTSQ
jgi:hypothetical protein